MSGPSQRPNDHDLATRMRDAIQQAFRDAERERDTDEEIYVGTLILDGKPTSVRAEGEGFAFTIGGVEYCVLPARLPESVCLIR
jgi:hypothetical protein